MVRCNLPGCYDHMCRHPYPGELGFSEAIITGKQYVEQLQQKLEEINKSVLETKATEEDEK